MAAHRDLRRNLFSSEYRAQSRLGFETVREDREDSKHSDDMEISSHLPRGTFIARERECKAATKDSRDLTILSLARHL